MSWFVRAISVQTLCVRDISGDEELYCSLKVQLCIRLWKNISSCQVLLRVFELYITKLLSVKWMQCTCCLFLQTLLGWKDRMMSSLCVSQCHCCMWLVPPVMPKGYLLRTWFVSTVSFSTKTTPIYFLYYEKEFWITVPIFKKDFVVHVFQYCTGTWTSGKLTFWKRGITFHLRFLISKMSRSHYLTTERHVNADWESGLKELSIFCIKKFSEVSSHCYLFLRFQSYWKVK